MIAASQVPRVGTGTLLVANPLGFSYSAARTATSFNHPWMPVLLGDGLRIGRGLVDGFEPTINGEPMSGSAGKLAPILSISYGEADKATNQSWVILNVLPNAQGVVDKDSKLTITHSNSPLGKVGVIGHTPLALIVWFNKKPVMVWPVTFFNLKYRQQKQADGTLEHFFL